MVALPCEGVGLVAGRGDGAGVRAERYYPGRNADASPMRYTMAPVEVTEALQDMERHGTRLGAIVHSHPRTPPVPSRTDLMEARFPGVLSLIVGFQPAVALRAWHMEFDRAGVATHAREVRVTVDERGAGQPA